MPGKSPVDDVLNRVDPHLQVFSDHFEISERMRKTLYYGKLPKTDRTSYSATEVAVKLFSQSGRPGLGQLDLDYATELSKNACVSPCTLILAMVYVERLRKRNPQYLNKIPSSEVFLVSLMVASKYLYDDGETDQVINEEWATASSSTDLAELNELELEFLSAIDWEVFASNDVFLRAFEWLEKEIALQHVQRRGWLTYTDALVLSTDLQVWHFVTDQIAKVMIVITVAYTTTVILLVVAVHATTILHQTNLAVMTTVLHHLSTMPTITLVPSEVPQQWQYQLLPRYNTCEHYCLYR